MQIRSISDLHLTRQPGAPAAAFDCEGAAAESVAAAKKAITRDLHITSQRKDIGNL
jgi:hypothetical protein